ncbi:MAG: glycosyltransferase [Actinobacteria bacterium]|nr:glycosyltransferase [Actinomycetota bacterium]MBM3711899.1 glycosyltransferase [Actinomycetota bacterium]
MILNIVTITKDDIEGLKKTITSTKKIREEYGICQIIVDSSIGVNKKNVINYLQNEKNIKYYWQEPSGIAAAFNFGLKNAVADWVWFLNGGDEVYDDLDTDFFLNLLSRSSSDAIIFQTENVQSNLIPKHPQMWALWPPLLSWIPHPSTITRRYLYDKYGRFNESLNIAMDYEFWIRCFSKDVTVDLISLPIAKFDQLGSYSKLNQLTRAEVRKIIIKYIWLILKKWFNNGLILLKSLKATSKFTK